MITAADEITIDFSTSCTKDVAVAKLLGWMQGSIRRRYIHITMDGISEEQLPYLHSLEDPLAYQLLELRQAAQNKLAAAFENDESDEVLTELELKVEHWDREIHRAAKYFRDIDDELAKGDQSELRIDQESTVKTGVTHIAISTLEQWAEKRKTIAAAAPSTATLTTSPPSIEIGSAHLSKGRKDLMTPAKAEGLYLTLAVLLDAFIEMSDPNYTHTFTPFNKLLHKDGRWVIQTIANLLEDRAAKANNNELFDGQLAEVIKDRIEAARDAKANAFKTK